MTDNLKTGEVPTGSSGSSDSERIYTTNDLRAQSAFLRWYITSLRQHWQTDADGQFGRTLALCGRLLDGEPNVLGVVRLVELFGEDVVREQALKAVQLSGQGQAAVLEQTGRAERTTGGILFYLVRQHYRQLQQQLSLSLQASAIATAWEAAAAAAAAVSQAEKHQHPDQSDVTLANVTLPAPGLDVTPAPSSIHDDTPAEVDVTFALAEQEQEQEQKIGVTSSSNQNETQSQSETEREETGEDDGWQGLKIPFLRLRYHRLIGSQSAVDVTPSSTATHTSADTDTATGTTQDNRGDRDVTPPSPQAGARASAGDNRWHEKLSFIAMAIGTGSGSGMGFDSLRQSYPAEFGNYVALERELCQLIVNMTNALVGGDKLWDTVSFQKVVSQIFGKRARY